MTIHIPDMTIRNNRKKSQSALIIRNCQHSGVISSRVQVIFVSLLLMISVVVFFSFILMFSLIFMKLKSHT